MNLKNHRKFKHLGLFKGLNFRKKCWSTFNTPQTPSSSMFPFSCITVIKEQMNAREWKNGFARKWESMITIEQQRLIEYNLQQAGLIKGQGRRFIDPAPKDLSNWTTRLVMIGILRPMFVSLYRNKLKQEQCIHFWKGFMNFPIVLSTKGLMNKGKL